MAGSAKAVAVLQAITSRSMFWAFKKTRGADRIAGDGLRGLGAVGQASGIAEIQIVSRQLLGHGLQHGKAANAGIEYADARKCH